MFHVTYEIVTPESAEHGDAAERGFVTTGGWHHELEPHIFGKAAGALKDGCGLTLREALALCKPHEDCGHWLAETDGDINYKTGAEERRSLAMPPMSDVCHKK